MKIELTKSQCSNLATFIDIWLLREIRENTELDNLDYVREMIDVQKIFEVASKKIDERNENNGC